MKLTTSDGYRIVISFKHEKFDKPRCVGHDWAQGLTRCWLTVNDVTRFYGLAYCSVSDNFCKETGRKLALTRAIKAGIINFPKKSRREIWEAYFNRSSHCQTNDTSVSQGAMPMITAAASDISAASGAVPA